METWFGRGAAWIEAHPVRAWALLLLVVGIGIAPEATFWHRSDYGGALFHIKKPHEQTDIGVVQDRAAEATAADLASYWFGPQIDRQRFFRPIPSILWVLQYRAFGTDDRRWNLVSLALHFLLCGALAWMAAGFWQGPRWQRMLVGLGTALLFGAPWLADRTVQYWTLTWWPAQPELLSLLFGSLTLGAAVRYGRQPRRVWACLAPLFFLLAVCSKEMGYLAGIGACLLLWRRRQGRALLAVLAFEGIGLFLYREWALEGYPVAYLDISMVRLARPLSDLRDDAGPAALAIGVHLLLAGIGAAAVLPFRRRVEKPILWTVGGSIYLVLACAILGEPWGPAFATGPALLFRLVVIGTLIFGYARLGRTWPYPELLAIAALVWVVSQNFVPIYGWYRLWRVALGDTVVVLALASLVRLLAERWPHRP